GRARDGRAGRRADRRGRRQDRRRARPARHLDLRAAQGHGAHPGSAPARAALPVRRDRPRAVRAEEVTHRVALLAVLAAFGLGGCAVAVVGAGAAAGYSVYQDRRSSGTQFDDQRIEWRAGSRIDERCGWTRHVNVTAYNRAVLITGEVPAAVTHAAVEKLVGALP